MFHVETSNAVDRVPRGTEAISSRPPTHESDDAELRELLREGLEGLAGVDSDSIESLLAFARLLESWAGRINLTGHRDALSIARHLILDAAALSPHLPDAERLTDIGSGAGLPGIPLAILRPTTRVLSVEPRAKRIYFQKAAARELGLSNLQPIQGRAEDVEPTQSDVVIAQAVGKPERVLDWMLAWCREGGHVAIPTSEATLSEALDRDPRIHDARTIPYQTPLAGTRHVLWIARKR